MYLSSKKNFSRYQNVCIFMLSQKKLYQKFTKWWGLQNNLKKTLFNAKSQKKIGPGVQRAGFRPWFYFLVGRPPPIRPPIHTRGGIPIRYFWRKWMNPVPALEVGSFSFFFNFVMVTPIFGVQDPNLSNNCSLQLENWTFYSKYGSFGVKKKHSDTFSMD